jgi:hypothetical protein
MPVTSSARDERARLTSSPRRPTGPLRCRHPLRFCHPRTSPARTHRYALQRIVRQTSQCHLHVRLWRPARIRRGSASRSADESDTVGCIFLNLFEGHCCVAEMADVLAIHSSFLSSDSLHNLFASLPARRFMPSPTHEQLRQLPSGWQVSSPNTCGR